MSLQAEKTLIGRDVQVRQLCRFLSREAGTERRVALLSGQAGIGKSTLARMVLDELAVEGWLVSSKFDQYLDGRPAGFFIDALTAVADRFLALPQNERNALRARLVDAVSPNGQLVINFCPRMADVLGVQPELIVLPPQENQVRLSMILRKLIGALTRQDYRLILHLDDLQWADAATVRLLCDLLGDGDVDNLAVLVAYRASQEGTASENANTLKRALQAAGIVILDIEVGVLAKYDIDDVIRQSFQLASDVRQQLAGKIKHVTDGVPLAVVNLLDVLIQKRILKKGQIEKPWSLSLDDAQEVLEETSSKGLVAIRLSLLDAPTLNLLTVASCIGQTFDAELLAELTEIPIEDILLKIAYLRNEHLVVASEMSRAVHHADRDVLRFSHDTLQQAVHERAEPAELKRIHLRCARIFARRFAEEVENDWLFRSVTLFNSAADEGFDTEERARVFNLNSLAARRALDTGGPNMALSFAQAATRLLPDDAWAANYDTVRDVHLTGAEAAYLCGETELLARFCASAADNARNTADWARSREILLQERVSTNALAEALDLAIGILRRLDAPMPRCPNKGHVVANFARTMLLLRPYSTEQLFQLPRMEDERAELEINTLMIAASAAYFAEPNLFALIVLRMVRLSVERGNATQSTFGWVCYGLAQCAVLGNTKSGYEYGILALRLTESFKADHLRARIHMLFNVFIRHWREARTAVADHLLEGEKAGFASGDPEFATYCMWHRCNDAFWSGTPLAEVRAMARDALAVSRQYNQKKTLFLFKMMRQFLDWSTASNERRPVPDDAVHEDYCTSRGDFTSLCYVKLFQALRHAINGDMASCYAATRVIDRHFEALQGQFYVPHYILLRTLAASACARGISGGAPHYGLVRTARWGSRLLKSWAKKGSVEAGLLTDLAEGYAVWARGSQLQALKHFDQALQSARGGTSGTSETASPMLAVFAAQALERLQKELGMSRGVSHSEAEVAKWATTWGCPLLAAQAGGGSEKSKTGRTEADLTFPPVPSPVGSASNRQAPDVQLARSVGRILDPIGGIRLEIVLLEDNDASTLMTAYRDGGAPLKIELTESNPERETLEIARRAAEIGEAVTESNADAVPSRLIAVSIPQHDGIGACLVIRTQSRDGHGVPFAQLRANIAPIVAVLRQERLKRQLSRAEGQRIALSTVHGRFVPQYFVRALGHREITELRVGDFAKKRMTVMFCDMRGSTAIVEEIGPQASMEVFNELFTAIESEVLRGGGYIDNFIGDAVLSLFETPADTVVRSAIGVSHELHRLHDVIASRGLPAPGFGIGMSTGDVVLGVVGGLNQIRGGSIGDSCNLAARIESLTPSYGASLLISESTKALLSSPNDFALRQVDHVTVVGRREPVRLYEVVDALPATRAEPILKSLAQFSIGVESYYARDFATAAKAFRDCLAVAPDDIPTLAMLERTQGCLQSEVSADWTGVRNLTQK